MPLLDPLKSMFEAQRAAPPMDQNAAPAELRAAMHKMIEQSFFALGEPQDPVRAERDIVIPVDGGTITLRHYADAEPGTLPCHVYYHGGGFFLGTLDHSNTYCRAVARAVGCAVISVDYRLAPEHRFPVAAEDSYAALRWIAEHAGDLGIDPARISVGGASAGGKLAAVVAQMSRDRGGPDLVGQVLEIPVTDFTSFRKLEFADEGISISSSKTYAPLYLRDEADAHDPLASPLLASSLNNLPPALILCAEYDQLQPEGEAYARRLEAYGVPTSYHLLLGEFHGSQGFDKVIPAQVKATRALVTRFLLKAYQLD